MVRLFDFIYNSFYLNTFDLLSKISERVLEIFTTKAWRNGSKKTNDPQIWYQLIGVTSINSPKFAS